MVALASRSFWKFTFLASAPFPNFTSVELDSIPKAPVFLASNVLVAALFPVFSATLPTVLLKPEYQCPWDVAMFFAVSLFVTMSPTLPTLPLPTLPALFITAPPAKAENLVVASLM
ncbi:MAG: hypothetical protein UU06_C0037G0002 [Parcubacteria group bacterium GW2011_GWB1_40_5]|nr:MAG: hypothetical protein UU06_C0037G0002 [Parcubacteria group bacterium GW2011_GWB1_40_5]